MNEAGIAASAEPTFLDVGCFSGPSMGFFAMGNQARRRSSGENPVDRLAAFQAFLAGGVIANSTGHFILPPM